MPDLHQEQKESSSSIFLELIKVVFWALVIIVPVRVLLFQPFFVQGASMEPNFYDGEYLIVNELGYKETDINFNGQDFFSIKPYKELSRGEIVVFRYPKNPSQYFIKRIIGLPGEKIEIKDNHVIIFNQENPDGFVLDESGYISPSTRTSSGSNQTFEIKKDEYLVLGDNREHSSDSRVWGNVPQKNIIGRVAIRAWPFDRIGFFK
jgi:signal peptidase I